MILSDPDIDYEASFRLSRQLHGLARLSFRTVRPEPREDGRRLPRMFPTVENAVPRLDNAQCDSVKRLANPPSQAHEACWQTANNGVTAVMKRPRIRLSSLLLLVACCALVMAVIMLAIENQRLRAVVERALVQERVARVDAARAARALEILQPIRTEADRAANDR
jgi:hypothetical protein